MLLFKKKFWKEFFANFRDSKWLLIRYLVVGIYLIVSGIIANRLELNELTYFNAVITLSYIGEMISFGCSEGFGMFANLNIENPDKYRKFIKAGFTFSTIVNLLFTVLLCVLPNFVIRTWLGLEFEVDKLFYFIMLVSFFISAVAQYISDILKKLGLFGWQMLGTGIKCGTTILGFLLLVVASTLVLRLIALVYIVASVLILVFSYLTLLKNKKFPINVLHFEKIQIGKGEFKTIIARSLSEIVFEVGYIFLSLFILRSSDILYNQYCYYENVLDILNGAFFAYVNVIAIKICRSIGEHKRARAYHHAVYSQWGVFVIWLAYVIISLSLYYPIRLGLNSELQATSFLPLVLYLVLSLVRWVGWSRCTYIIGQCERYAGFGLVWECVVSVYYVLLYFIAQVIPYSIYGVYVLIGIESVIKIFVYGKIINNKKWLLRPEEHLREEELLISSAKEQGSVSKNVDAVHLDLASPEGDKAKEKKSANKKKQKKSAIISKIRARFSR
ncbi:MAG: hypothetical protein E7354_03660 [Clostridiales bacterium]|nr:hypothetical protein [Clostridiales bacterium]